MLANELKLGNYVLHNGNYAYVTQLFTNKVELCAFRNGEEKLLQCTYEELEPIPLTVEVLEKCDLEKHERFHYSNVYHSARSNFTINQMRDSMEISFSVNSDPAIIGVGDVMLHQLQNLYFILHNEELGVQLNVQEN